MMNQPNLNDYQQLFDELRNLDAASESKYDSRKYEIIHDLAEAHFYEARPYFIIGLENPDPDYRLACISALITHWQDTDLQIISHLLEISTNDPDISVRYSTIDSLKKIKVQEALPVLKKIAENKKADLQLRNTTYKAFLEIANSFPEIKEFPKFDLQIECRYLFEELKRLEAASTHEWTEREYNIINDLAVAGFYEAKPYFIAGLDNSDPIYRKACIVALGQTWKDKSVEFISKLLDKAKNDPDDSVKDVALFTLGLLKVKDALPLLKKIVEDDTRPFLSRKTAYSQILNIYSYPPKKVLAIMEKFDLNSIDKDLLNNIPDTHE